MCVGSAQGQHLLLDFLHNTLRLSPALPAHPSIVIGTARLPVEELINIGLRAVLSDEFFDGRLAVWAH
jgi:hypothetical protein